VELVRPLIMLDRQPGGEWNYKRIFPGDTTTVADTAPGWGDWISFTNVTVVDGRMVVRTPWEPSSDTPSEERAKAAEDALAGGERSHVIRAANGGLQKEMEFRQLNGKLPRVRLTDPEETTMLVQVATLQTIAALFNPPDAEIRDLNGSFQLTGDSAWWSGVNAKLPGSTISGDGRYAYGSGDMRLRLRGAPVTTADLRWLFPRLPADGAGSLDFAMDWIGDTAVYIARNADLKIEQATLAGDFGITIADTVTFHNTDLRFANLGTRLIQQIAPAVKLPRQGTLAGRAALAGGLNALDVNGDVAFDDERSGRSRVIANGEVGFQNALRARQLKLNLAPVQVDLVRIVAKDFPVGGTVTGTVTVDGSSKGWLGSDADLTHQDGGERSHILGDAEFRLGQQQRWMDVNVQAAPISLVTVGRFVPAAELRGQAAGPIRLTGPFSELAVRADLGVTGGGGLAVRGTLDVASQELGYNLAAVANLFNANVVVARLPQTSLTATASAQGRGFDPATMRANIAADIATSVYDSLAIDSMKVRVAIADGLARVDTLVVRAPSSRADVRGTFGLTGAHEGNLVYVVGVDSLAAFSRWLPARDTTAVAPRPRSAALALARARQDSARVAESVEVERAVTGRATEQPIVMPDTAVKIAKDSLAGTIYAAGTLKGNVARFDARGRAAIEGLVYGGNTVRHSRIEYGLVNGGTDQPAVAAAIELDSAQAAGFSLDSVAARVSYRGTEGDVAVVITQSDEQQYSVNADFTLHADHREVHLNQLALRFDTAYWRAARPGTIRWGAPGIEVVNLDLRNGPSGRIFVDGRLPSEGSANLDVEIDNFEIANIVALLQSDLDMRGLVSLTADVTGTTSAPRFEGAAGIANGAFRGSALPELHSTFRYADQRLTASAQASRPGGPAVLTAEGMLPINLGSAPGPRLPDAPMAVDVTINRMPLEFIPRLTDAITGLKGVAVGQIAARGTVRAPKLAGALQIADAEARIAALGVTLRRMGGALHMASDSVVIDSIAASSGGRVRLTGGLGLATLAQPSFDLRLTAQNAIVLNNDRGDGRINADITMKGPFDNAYITGNATVLNGVFYIPESDNKSVIGPGDPTLFAVVDTTVAESRTLFPGQSPLFANLRMDVDVVVNRDTWVRSKDANVEIYSDGDLVLHVDRAKQALALDGVVSTERGQYTFLSRRFEVRRGSATFIGGESGLNPTLQITAEHLVQLPASDAITIRVVLGGTLERPTIALTSDAQPPLSSSDLLSYVAFGRSSSSLLQLGGSGVAGGTGGGGLEGVSTFAGQQLVGIALGVAVDEIEGEAARSLGADVLNITPADVYTEVTQGNLGRFFESTEFEVGKYFDTDTFGAVQTRLSTRTIPGLRLQRRLFTDYRIEGSFEPRLQLRQPSLSDRSELPSFSVFGVFLIREWRF
jgi:translocation and assembly module TamB